MFLQETHFCEKDDKKQNDDFQGALFFLYGTTNSCGVAIGYSGAKSFTLEGKKRTKTVIFYFQTLKQMTKILNLHYVYTEKDQLNTINELNEILEMLTTSALNK